MSSYGTNGTNHRDNVVPLVAPRSGTESPIRAQSRPVGATHQKPIDRQMGKVVPVVQHLLRDIPGIRLASTMEGARP